jgi:MFS family permease
VSGNIAAGRGADDSRPSSQAGWTAVAVFLGLYALAYLDRQIITLLVEPLKRDLGISDFQISVLQGAAFIILYTLFAIPIGWLVDRFQRRLVAFGGIVTWSIGAAASGFAQTYAQLLATRAVVGAGEAALSPSAYSILSDLFPKHRLASAMSVYSTGAMIGSAMSFMLGGLIISLTSQSGAYHLPLIGSVHSWQLVFLITGAPGLVLAFTTFIIKEPPRRGVLRESSRPQSGDGAGLWRYLSGQRAFYFTHIAGFSLFAVVTTGYASWGPTYLMRAFHWSVRDVGVAFGLMSLVGGVSGALAGGWFVDRLFRRGVLDAHMRIYVCVTLATGAAGIVASLSNNIFIVLTAMTLEKFLVPFIGIAATALQITTPNQFRGQVSALFLFFYNVVGFGLGTSVIAGISDFLLGGPEHIGGAIALTFAVACPLASVIFAVGLRPMRRAVRAAEAWSG